MLEGPHRRRVDPSSARRKRRLVVALSPSILVAVSLGHFDTVDPVGFCSTLGHLLRCCPLIP
jgi:hypothetical protein